MRKTYTFLLGLLAVAINSQAQDLIYQIDERKIPGKISEITAQKVRYKNPANPAVPYALDKNMLLMAFSETGNYLVFTSGGNTAEETGFLKSTPKRNSDILVTIDNEVIPAKIEKVGDTEVNYQKFVQGGAAAGSSINVNKNNLLIILYEDGRHELFISPTDAATVLKTVKSKVDALMGIDAASQPVATTPAPANTNAGDPTMGIDFEEYSNKALVKVEELGGYLTEIADKSTPFEETNKVIDLACDLFVNKGENSRIEISKVSSKKKDKYLIRAYLNKLKITKYDKVKIEWANIQYVSELRKGADGNYYGVVTFEQTFEGLIENKVVYKDVTKKNVEVVVKAYSKAVDGETKEVWDAFLSDIGVVETRI